MSIEGTRINLQNTADPAGVDRRAVRFARDGVELSGLLFTPAGDGPWPGVVVTGAWTTVKEQMAGTYARALAERGFAALAFDFAGWGESAGGRRFVESPREKTADIRAAAAFLGAQPAVKGVSGLGICASAGYMAAVAADGALDRLALVAPWLHDRGLVEAVYGGAEAVDGLIAAGRAAAEAEPAPMVAASATDEGALMYGAPYYTEPDRGLIAAYDNAFDPASWADWLTYDALESADRLDAPTMVVCSDAAALPAGARAYVKRTAAPVAELWLDDVSQFDFYDRRDVLERAADAVAGHLGGAEAGR